MKGNGLLTTGLDRRVQAETPDGHAVRYDESGALVGLTLIDVRGLLNDAQGGELLLELPAKARSADLELALA